MGAPSGPEIVILDKSIKRRDYRMAVMLGYPAMTGSFTDTFGADLDKKDWIYTEFGGPPTVTGGKLKIQLYGGPCREFAVVRPQHFPRDLSTAFTITFNVAFPAADPVFNAVVTVGGIANTLGSDNDPFRIVEAGSTRFTGADVGQLRFNCNGQFQTPVANDLANHAYEVRYNPAGGVNTLVIKVDGVEIYPAGGDSTGASRPYYVMFGLLERPEALTSAQQTTLRNGGTAGPPAVYNPLPIIEVSDITITADVYDTLTYPAWTTTNLGNTISTAADGERYTENGLTWAKLPKTQVQSLHTVVGRSLNQPFDSLEADLLAMLTSDPVGTPYLFDGDLLTRRPVVVDARIGDPDSGDWCDWRRLICAVLDSKHKTRSRLRLAGRDRPSVKLDTFFPVGYMNVDVDDSVADGAADIRQGLLLSEIFQDLVDITDALYGDPLGITETLIRLIDQAPQMLTDGGGSLLGVLQEWVDRAVQEMWREYEVSGDAEHGRLRTNLYTLDEFLTPDYTFRGAGSTNPNIVAGTLERMDDARKGPSQALYRNDSPAVPLEGRNIEQLDILGVFPTFNYPVGDRPLPDSYGPFADVSVSSLLDLKDKANGTQAGGVAMWRYRQENSFRRSVTFEVIGHHWPQPTLVIAIDAPDDGISDSETWVIDNVDTTIAGGQLRTRIQCTSTDWLKAIRETM